MKHNKFYFLCNTFYGNLNAIFKEPHLSTSDAEGCRENEETENIVTGAFSETSTTSALAPKEFPFSSLSLVSSL